MAKGIYCASKVRHAPMWLALRSAGAPIIATWIDEAGPGESSNLTDLAERCVSEAANASFVLVYCEPGETLKGALVEIGAALASGVPVRCVGECASTSSVFSNHPLWSWWASVNEAIAEESTTNTSVKCAWCLQPMRLKIRDEEEIWACDNSLCFVNEECPF